MPTAEALARRIVRGDVQPNTQLFDVGTGKWTLAREAPIVKFIVDEIMRDKRDALPGWSSLTQGARDRAAPAARPSSANGTAATAGPASARPRQPEPRPRAVVPFSPAAAERKPLPPLATNSANGARAEVQPAAPVPAPSRPVLKVVESSKLDEPKPTADEPAKASAGGRRRQLIAAGIVFVAIAGGAGLVLGSRGDGGGDPYAAMASLGANAGIAGSTPDSARLAPGSLSVLGDSAEAVSLFISRPAPPDTVTQQPEPEPPPPPEPEIRFVVLPAPVRPATESLPDPALPAAAVDPQLAAPRLEEVPPPPDFTNIPVADLPAAPADGAGDISDQPVVTPFDVPPRVRNLNQVREALRTEYPVSLRAAGIGGRVEVWFFINENGVVEKTQISLSSGHPQLDSAALRVAEVYEFAPAQYQQRPVPVWVLQPITFDVR